MRPVNVYVIWSESSDITDREMYGFHTFELKAKRVALDNTRGGYYKTKVTVIFDNGATYGPVRLDLAPEDTLNFADYVRITLNYYNGNLQHSEYTNEDFLFLKNINFD